MGILPEKYLEGLVGKRIVLRASDDQAKEHSGILLLYVTDYPDERKGFQDGLLVVWDDQDNKLKTFNARKTPYVAPMVNDTAIAKTETFHLQGYGKVVVMSGETRKPKQ